MSEFVTQVMRAPKLKPRWMAHMADVALALLIAAAVLVPWWLTQGSDADRANLPPIEVRVTQTPVVMVDAHPVPRDALVAHLRKLDPDGRTVLVRADPGVKFDRVRSVLTDCEDLGFGKVTLLQPEPAQTGMH